MIEGGTHDLPAPSFDFLERAFLPLVGRIGPSFAARLERHGFYPARSGRIVVGWSAPRPLRVGTRNASSESMKVTVQLPAVSGCSVTDCAYNRDHRCHALAITVGDDGEAACDTFCETGAHVRDGSPSAGVGACKVSSCRFNSDLECQAASVRVGYQEDRCDCLTFKPA